MSGLASSHFIGAVLFIFFLKKLYAGKENYCQTPNRALVKICSVSGGFTVASGQIKASFLPCFYIQILITAFPEAFGETPG